MKRRITLTLILTVLVCLLLSVSASAATVKPSTADTASAAEALKAANAEKYGGEMRIEFDGISPTMDIHSSNAISLYTNRWGLHIYDGLLTLDVNGKTYPNIMDLEESADGCTYTLTLRDRHFSNGKKITMDDIEASLRRYVAMNYTTRAGYDKYWNGTTWNIDGDQIIFQTKQYNINFGSILKSVSGSFKIMPKEICEKWAPDWTTGTYDPATDLTWGCTKVNEITDVADVIGNHNVVEMRVSK